AVPELAQRVVPEDGRHQRRRCRAADPAGSERDVHATAGPDWQPAVVAVGRDDRLALRRRDDGPRYRAPPGFDGRHGLVARDDLEHRRGDQRRGPGLAAAAARGVLPGDLPRRVDREGPRWRACAQQAAHIAVGVDMDGIKHVLGIWIQVTEGAKFWAGVCAELANRGVRDVLIVCCDGLTGFPEAIEATWPDSMVQICVVHLIRNAMRFVGYGQRKAVAAALKPIYQAATADAAVSEL